MPSYHPGEDLLIDYAAGTLEEPIALLVATHLALCPACRHDVDRLDEVGGALLESMEPASVGEHSLEALMARLDQPAPAERAAAGATAGQGDPRVPRPLRDYLAEQLDDLPWKGMSGIEEVELLPESGFHSRLMRIKAGRALPRHTHEGTELTLVIAGGFSDEDGHYQRGDVAHADSKVNHKPVADPGEDCICLAVTDAPLRLTGRFSRLLNPFIRI